ncbi:BLUF domain-containing protein [Lacimicrobium sp. SS2-24]|uniref:BLUF domain-containing protein n=1 Tax=Lacimicrobium sp. SS2-24 TaxID=2005569 RepID=UPI00143A1A0C|nr:BLUF domain-containing protein [Lacimicrobium sp. SS2-24]
MNQSVLHQLIYISDAAVAVTQELLSAIKDRAQKYNPEKDITGRLLATDRHFVQVLEGPKDAVEALMNNIRQDSRHQNVRILSLRPADGRQFVHWSMGVKSYLDAQEEQDMIQVLNMYGGCQSFTEQQISALEFMLKKA